MDGRRNIKIVTIGDYGRGELASLEVRDRIEAACDEHNLTINSYAYYAVQAFNTVAAGFSLAQLALTTKQPHKKVFFVNVAPRGDDAKPRVNNEGEGFVYAKLYNGVEVFAVNSGYTLSFLKKAAVELREINVKREGSQFRSRDIFPPAMAAILAGDRSLLGKPVDLSVIPDKEKLENVICHIDGYGRGDGYGNLKIYLGPDSRVMLEKSRGKEVFVTIGDDHDHARTHLARVTERIFDVADGEIAFASAGSSGWKEEKDGLALVFAEIVVRSGSAYERFGRPKVGSRIGWRLTI